MLALPSAPIKNFEVKLDFCLFLIFSVCILTSSSRCSILIKYSSKSIIARHIRFELARGGQCYIVYNNVNNIEIYTKRIISLVPSARVGFIHGQLPSKKIEQSLASFINKKINVLVCSSIIEAGIDVPNANTIIIENAVI